MAVDLQSIYMLASGGKRALEQLDVTSNNVANVDTPGFKKILETEMYQNVPVNGGEASKLLTFPRFRETTAVLAQGSLKKTDSPLDFAISGEGFFKVQSGDEILLTRDGHFFVNRDGYLVDTNGNYVLDENNKPILLDGTKPFTVSPDGRIYQDNMEISNLGMDNYEGVEPVGNCYYKGLGNKKEANYKILTGYLEESNVNPMTEMVNLIEAQRRFEMYGNLIRGLDRMNIKSVEIGKV